MGRPESTIMCKALLQGPEGGRWQHVCKVHWAQSCSSLLAVFANGAGRRELRFGGEKRGAQPPLAAQPAEQALCCGPTAHLQGF